MLHAIRCRLHDKIAREYLAGPEKTIRDLYLLLEGGRKRARTKLSKRGLWRTFQWDRDVAYARWKIEAETARFQAHPSHAVLLEDARHFFKHIGFFTHHGQSGMRKLLLTGPPGTGKTSILMALATELGRTFPSFSPVRTRTLSSPAPRRRRRSGPASSWSRRWTCW